MQHFPSILAHLVHQALSNNQQSGEGCFDNLIKICPVFSRLETEDPTNGKETLQACEDRGRIVRVEQLNRDVDKRWPSFREIVMQYLLEDRDKLVSNLGGRGGQDRQQAFSKSSLLIFRYDFIMRTELVRFPSSCNTILQVDNRCTHALVAASSGVGLLG